MVLHGNDVITTSINNVTQENIENLKYNGMIAELFVL